MFIKTMVCLSIILFVLINELFIKKIEEQVDKIEFQERQKANILKCTNFLSGIHTCIMIITFITYILL